MAKYYQLFTEDDDKYPKPIVIGAHSSLDVRDLILFYRPELLNEKYNIIPVTDEVLMRYLSMMGEDSVDFI